MNFRIGDKVSLTKSFSQEEVMEYAKSSMDENPLHYDETYSQKTFFKKTIVHGLFAASLFGGLLGSKLPGRGTIHLGQELKFIKPIFVGEMVTATIEIIAIRDDKPVITVNCVMVKEDNSIAIEGKAVVIYKGEIFIK